MTSFQASSSSVKVAACKGAQPNLQEERSASRLWVLLRNILQ